MIAREYVFTEGQVREWCEDAGDHNPLHLEEQPAGPFDERVVPGMMVLDRVSGLLSQLAEVEDGDVVILASIVATRFREPLFLGETVEISVEIAEREDPLTYVDFEARSVDRDVLTSHGTISIVIE